MSGDGRVFTGALASIFGAVGFVLKTPTSIVCHAPAGSPTQLETTIVSFPQGLDAALAGGDTLGPCQCNTTAPTGIPTLTIGKSAGTAQLTWSAVDGATGYDIARGSLARLRSSHGDFEATATDCLDNDLTATSRDDADPPALPERASGIWSAPSTAQAAQRSIPGLLHRSARAMRGSQASPSACP